MHFSCLSVPISQCTCYSQWTSWFMMIEWIGQWINTCLDSELTWLEFSGELKITESQTSPSWRESPRMESGICVLKSENRNKNLGLRRSCPQHTEDMEPLP
jgi:hypothetical protein